VGVENEDLRERRNPTKVRTVADDDGEKNEKIRQDKRGELNH